MRRLFGSVLLAAASIGGACAAAETQPVFLYTAERPVMAGMLSAQRFEPLKARPRNGLPPDATFDRVGMRLGLPPDVTAATVKLSLHAWKGDYASSTSSVALATTTIDITSPSMEYHELRSGEPLAVGDAYLVLCEVPYLEIAGCDLAILIWGSCANDGGEGNDAFSGDHVLEDCEYQVRLAGGTIDRPWTDPRFGVGAGDRNDEFRFGSIKTWGVNEGHLASLEATHCGIAHVSWSNKPKYIAFDPTTRTFAVDNVAGHPAFGRVRDLVTRFPGRVWEIGNEPDWGPYFRPVEYAKWYHEWYTEIRRWDPTAKVMTGGIAWPIYDNPHKWRAKELIDSPDLDRPDLEEYSKEFRNSNAWMLLVMAEYRRMYGVDMPVDIYGFHPYNTQYGTAGVPADIENAKRNFVSFRGFLETIGQGHKPAWATEWGLLASPGSLIGRPYTYRGPDGCGTECVDNGMCYAHGEEVDACCWPYAPDPDKDCFTFEERQAEWQSIAEFMEGIVPWIVEGRYAQRWHWWMSGDSAIRKGNSEYIAPSVFFVQPDGDLCLAAKVYRGLAFEYADYEAPVVESVRAESRNGELEITVRASDVGNAGIAEYFYAIGTNEEEEEYVPWTWVGDIRDETLFRIPWPQAGHAVVRVRAADAAGNVSEPAGCAVNPR